MRSSFNTDAGKHSWGDSLSSRMLLSRRNFKGDVRLLETSQGGEQEMPSLVSVDDLCMPALIGNDSDDDMPPLVDSHLTHVDDSQRLDTAISCGRETPGLSNQLKTLQIDESASEQSTRNSIRSNMNTGRKGDTLI